MCANYIWAYVWGFSNFMWYPQCSLRAGKGSTGWIERWRRRGGKRAGDGVSWHSDWVSYFASISQTCTQNKVFLNGIFLSVGWTINERETKTEKLRVDDLLVVMTGDPHRRTLTDESCNNLRGGTDTAWSTTWNMERETEWLWEGKTTFWSLSWNLLVMTSSLMTSRYALEQRATAQQWLPGDQSLWPLDRSPLLSVINSLLSVEHGHVQTQMQCNSLSFFHRLHRFCPCKFKGTGEFTVGINKSWQLVVRKTQKASQNKQPSQPIFIRGDHGWIVTFFKNPWR